MDTNIPKHWIIKNPKASDFPQKEDGWCGPAALSYAAAQQGVYVKQSSLAKFTGTTIRNGVEIKDLMKGARRLGFKLKTIRGKKPSYSLSYLNKEVKKGNSVVVDWLLGNDITEDGHYSVFKGTTTNKVKLWDPSPGKMKVLNKENFIKRWKDQTISGKSKDYRWAMILRKEA